MNDYVERLAVSAIRCTGQPCTISPQLEDFCSFPNLLNPLPCSATDFRLIRYVGFIDPTDIVITFPRANTVKVNIRHEMKAVKTRLFDQNPMICSGEVCSFFTLPANVEEYSLSAQLTQDGFLVVRSRALTTKVTGFNVKRLVPVKVCYKLDPGLSLMNLKAKALELLEDAAVQCAKVDSLCPIGLNPPDSVDRSKKVSEKLDPGSDIESLEENRLPEPILPLPIDSSGPSDRTESESRSLPKENLFQQEDVDKRKACVEDESSSFQDNYPSAEDQNIVTHARAPSVEKQQKAVKLSAVEPESSNREPGSKVGSPNTRMADDKKHEDATKNEPKITSLREKDAKYEEPTTEEPCLEKDKSKEDSTEEESCLEEKGDESKEKSTIEISSLEENSMNDIPALETGNASQGRSTEETLSLNESTEISTAEKLSLGMDVNKKHSSKESLIEKNTKSEELSTIKLGKSFEELRLERKSDESKEISAEESCLQKNVYIKEPSAEMEVSLGKDIERKEPSSEEESSLEKNVDSKEQSSEKETGPDKDIEGKGISAEVLVSKSGLEKDGSCEDHSIGDKRELRKRAPKKEKSSAEESIIKKDSIGKQASSREELMDDSSISESQKAIGCESGSSDLDKTYTKDDLSKAHDPSTKKTLTKDKECHEEEQSIEVKRGHSEEKATTSSRRDSEQSTVSTEPESSDQESQPETRRGKAKASEEKSRSEASKGIPKRGVRLLQKTVSSASAQPPDSPAKSTRSTTRGGAIRGEREEPVTPSKRAAKERASRSLLSSLKPKEDSKRKKP